MERFLAFDYGASNGRVTLAEIGKNITLTEMYRFDNEPVEILGHTYWDIADLYRHLLKGLKTYRSQDGGALTGIGVDSWAVDIGFLDSAGNLLGLPHTYRDRRSFGTDSYIDEKIGNSTIYEKTGIQFLLINTINQFAAMARDGDPIRKYADTFLFIADLLHYFLTGEKVSEFTLSSVSQTYNNVTGMWDPDIFQAFGFDPALGPKVIRPGTIIGNILPDVQEAVGLQEVPVVTPACHDTASAGAAIPAIGNENWAFLSSGTWSMIGFELDAPVINDASFEMNVSNSGGAFGKTLYLKNVMGLWIIQECKLFWDENRPDLTYADIVRLAESSGEPPFYIDPDDVRFFNPKDMIQEIITAGKESGVTGLKESDIGTISNIVYQSLALKYRYTLEKLQRANSREVERMYVIGGGSKNELLNQYTADCMNIELFAGPVEATTIGNVIIQAVGTGVIQDHSTAREMIASGFSVKKYIPRNTAYWESKYASYIDSVAV